jgi:hypothetical protein
MGFVIIPFDYDALPASAQAATVPICIARNDDAGRPIAWEWFEAVARIPERLHKLAQYYLGDVWRASEVSEGALHKIWRLHGRDFGERPECRVYAQAVWYARDLQAGSWRERRGIVTTIDALEEVVRERILVDRKDYDAIQHNLDFAVLSKRLIDEGLEDVSVMLDLLRDGCTWQEVGERLGKSGDAARMMFHRKIPGFTLFESRR